MATDTKLWKVFSLFTRLRDTDEKGYGKCITCGKVIHYTDGDAGHGVGRQHKATKFDEKNSHLQCRRCNYYGAGEQAIYKEEVEKRYGKGTWDTIVLKSRQVCKRGQVEIDTMTEYYKNEVKKLKQLKGL
jgi:hypothetical protein